MADYLELLGKVTKVRSRTWSKAQEKHNRKMLFLIDKLGSCCETHKAERRTTARGRGCAGKNNLNLSDPLVAGTMVSDKDLDDMFLEEETAQAHMYNEKHVMIYGDVDLDDNEREILKRRPEFAVLDKFNMMTMEEKFNITLTKVRWDR